MRAVSLLLKCCVLAVAVSAHNAYLYTFDHSAETAPAQSSIISTATAFTIIARRRGIPEERFLSDVEEATLQQIISYSGFQQQLFEEKKEKAPRSNLFIRISGVAGKLVDDVYPRLTVSNAGSEFITEIQARKDELCLHGAGEKVDYALTMEGEAGDGYRSVSTDSCKMLTDFISKRDARPFGALAMALKELSGAMDNPTSAITHLLDVLHELSTSHSVQSTLLLLEGSSPTEREQNMIARPLARREESPLDFPTPDVSSSSPPSHVLVSNFTLPSNLPSCFSSQSACENATNSCFGHGSCVKNHGSSSCYKCACKSTIVRENADGSTKSVQWAGAACQKKDVSAPFFLFASFGVAFVTLVTGAIGMLYSMGSEELPSVIGAGVAGPRAQK